jgi:hypothetical protein
MMTTSAVLPIDLSPLLITAFSFCLFLDEDGFYLFFNGVYKRLIRYGFLTRHHGSLFGKRPELLLYR